MVPVERKVISRLNFDSVVGLNITHDVASHVNGVEILDRRIVVAALAILAIVRRNSDALECTLIYAVDENTLKELVMRPDKLSSE